MLTCHGCMRTCLQNIIGDSVFISSIPRTNIRNLGHTLNRRNYASLPRTQKIQDRELQTQLDKSSQDQGFRRTTRQQWLDSRGTRPPDKPKPSKSELPSASANAIRFLKKDPLKLAEFIRETLRGDDFETAIDVVRDASKDIQCVVSWNHLIDWQLSQGKMNGAIKTYNEMKKRAQTPDAHTYTIIFRGCAEHKDSSQALAKVLTMYQSMLTEKAPVKPNTIHMNAILKMCARAQDIEALMSVASQLPEKGVRAANNLTFTTIINALRISAIVDLRGSLSPMQKRANAKQGILQGRHIWQDITTRWRAGDIWIDEELVCAMGRLLLISEDRQDWDDVLSLIQQTMRISRPLPSLGSPERALIEPASQGRGRDNENTSANIKESVEDLESTDVAYFESITPPDPPARGLSAYAKPGQNSLSLVLEVLLKLEVKAAATKYWDIFTKEHKVIPDRENYIAYLRILRVARASTETVQLLTQMPLQNMEVKTFRIAIAACERDKNNHHAFSNAGKVLDLMQSALKEPDIKVLCAYLEIALSSSVYSKHVNAAGKKDWSPLGQGQQIMRALQRLNPSFLNIKNILFFNDGTSSTQPTRNRNALVDETRTLVGRMVAAYNRLLDKELAPKELHRDLTNERNKLSAFLNRHSMSRSNRQVHEASRADQNRYKQALESA